MPKNSAPITKQPVNDPALIAACGLYCGSCSRYLKSKCPGCQANDKATWCKIRSCVLSQGIASCAACTTSDYQACRIFNNPIGRFFSFIFRSNRPACIARIREIGPDAFASEMAKQGTMTIRR
jgi:hypothetical protein